MDKYKPDNFCQFANEQGIVLSVSFSQPNCHIMDQKVNASIKQEMFASLKLSQSSNTSQIFKVDIWWISTISDMPDDMGRYKYQEQFWLFYSLCHREHVHQVVISTSLELTCMFYKPHPASTLEFRLDGTKINGENGASC